MTLEHVAIWTNQLETLKDYYVKYFQGTSNDKYTNSKKDFHSYFLSFCFRRKIGVNDHAWLFPAIKMIRYKNNIWASFILRLVLIRYKKWKKKPGNYRQMAFLFLAVPGKQEMATMNLKHWTPIITG